MPAIFVLTFVLTSLLLLPFSCSEIPVKVGIGTPPPSGNPTASPGGAPSRVTTGTTGNRNNNQTKASLVKEEKPEVEQEQVKTPVVSNSPFRPYFEYQPSKPYRKYLPGNNLEAGTLIYCEQNPNTIYCKGTKIHCEDVPLATTCKGTAAFCEYSPLNLMCQGTKQHCEQVPDSNLCVATKAFCENNPLHDSCTLTKAFCYSVPGRAGCPAVLQDTCETYRDPVVSQSCLEEFTPVCQEICQRSSDLYCFCSLSEVP